MAITVVLLLALALAVRVLYALHTQNYVAVLDAHSYDVLGSQMAAGHGWATKLFGYAYRPPGYPFFLSGIYDLVGLPHGTDRTAARIVQGAVLGTGTVALIGLLARELFGKTAMLIALGLAAIYLPLVVVGESLMTESLFTPLAVAATYCALRSRRAVHRSRWALATGLLCGLASLTRTNGLILGVVLAVLVFRRERGASRRGASRREPGLRGRVLARALIAPALVILATAITIAPWTVRNAEALHAFVPVTVETGPTLAGTYNHVARGHDWLWTFGGYDDYGAITSGRRLSSPELDRKLTSAVVRYVERHPVYLPQVILWNTVRLLDLGGRRRSRITAGTDVDASAGVADAMTYSFWIVGALALAGIFTRAVRRAPLALWLVPVAVWLSTAAVTTGTPRFRSALEPFVIVLAALALLAGGRGLAASRGLAAGRANGAPPG